MAKKAKAASKPKESLVVGSKVKAFIKSKKGKTSGELLAALNDKVGCILECAVERAVANRRTTVKAQDI